MTTEQELLENHWMNLCQSDDSDSLKFIFLQTYDDLFRYANKLLRSTEQAKDAIQNTFADIWQYRYSIKHDVPVKAYLFKSVRNHSIRLLRRADPTVDLEEISKELVFLPTEITDERIDEERSRHVANLLNSLTERQREILYLRYFENLKYQSIADILGLNYQSVVNHAHKAVLHLRKNRNFEELLSS